MYHFLITVRHFYYCHQILCNFRSNAMKIYDVIVRIVSARTEKKVLVQGWHIYKLCFVFKRETNEFWLSCSLLGQKKLKSAAPE